MTITDEQRQKLMQDYSVWEEDDKGNTKLILPNLGELIFNELNYHFLTTIDSEEIFSYNGGYYEPKGEQIIRDLVEQFLGKYTREHYKNEVLGYIRDKNYQKREIFNTPVHLINLKNGVYNLETGELLEHDSKYYFVNELPIEYDPKADCREIKQFIGEVVYPDDIPVIQESFGYCLYRRYHIHRACMFLGGGKNGKSTTIRLLVKLLGEKNVANKALQDLIYYRFARNALFGRLLNAAADISDQALKQTGLFKELTGEDRVDADKKFKDSYQFTNYAKFLFSANQLPKADDESYAYYRRWILISFPNTFEGKDCDPNILETLTTPQELSGLFNWSVEGLKRLLKNGDFSYGKTVEEVMEQYKTMSDPIYAYCADFLKCETGKYIFKNDLWEHYTKWCQKNKLPITPRNILTQELSNNLPELRPGQPGGRGNRKPAYMNINWQEKDENDVDLDNFSENPCTELTGVDA